MIRVLAFAGKRPRTLWPTPGSVTSSACVTSLATASARPWGWMWSSSPCSSSIGQLILRYIASLTSNDGGMVRASTVLARTAAGGVARPGDAVLDLLGRMRLGEDVAHEMLGEVGIVGQPMGAVELVPALEALALGEEIPLRHVGMLGPDGRHGACRDDGLHPFGMVRGQDGGEQAAIGQADQDGLSGIGGVHDGQRVGHVVLQRVGRHVFRPVGLAVAAAVIGDAAEALAEVRQLRLVDARMDDHPGRHEDHRLGPVAVDLVMQLHAVAFDESFLGGQLCAHEITLSPTGFRPCG